MASLVTSLWSLMRPPEPSRLLMTLTLEVVRRSARYSAAMVATSDVFRGPLRPSPPNSSRASPISLALSPARRDMTEYRLADHGVLGGEGRHERALDDLRRSRREEPGGAPPVVRAESKVRERTLEQHQGIERHLRCCGERFGARRREAAAQVCVPRRGGEDSDGWRAAFARLRRRPSRRPFLDRSFITYHLVMFRNCPTPPAILPTKSPIPRVPSARRIEFARISEPGRCRICGKPSVASSPEFSTNDNTSSTNSSCACASFSSAGSSAIARSRFRRCAGEESSALSSSSPAPSHRPAWVRIVLQSACAALSLFVSLAKRLRRPIDAGEDELPLASVLNSGHQREVRPEAPEEARVEIRGVVRVGCESRAR